MKNWVSFAAGFKVCALLVAYMLGSRSLFAWTSLFLAVDYYFWRKLGTQ